MAPNAMRAAQVLRLVLFILSAFLSAYNANDRRPVLSVYWIGVAVYWLLNYIIS